MTNSSIALWLCFLVIQAKVISSRELIGSRYEALKQLLREVDENPTRNVQLSPSFSKNSCTGVTSAPGDYLLSSSPSALFCSLQIEAPENYNIEVELIRAPKYCNKRSYYLTVQGGRRAALPQQECMHQGQKVVIGGNHGQVIFRLAAEDFATVQLRFLPSHLVCNGVVELSQTLNQELVSAHNQTCQLTLLGPSIITLETIQTLCESSVNGTGNSQFVLEAFGMGNYLPEFSVNVCDDKEHMHYLFHCQKVVVKYRNSGPVAHTVKLQAQPWYSISTQNTAESVKKICFN